MKLRIPGHAPKLFALGAIIGASIIGGGAQAANISCPSCALQGRLNSQQPVNVIISDQNADNMNLGLNVAGFLSRVNTLQFTPQAPLAGVNNDTKFWNGQGELPGRFIRPWDFPASNFDPSFITDYYTSQQGMLTSMPPSLGSGISFPGLRFPGRPLGL